MTDKQLIKIVAGFSKGIIGKRAHRAMCYAVVLPLHSYLSIMGFQTEITKGEIKGIDLWNHFWLTLPDGRILDPTASQFKDPDGKEMPIVFLGEKPDWYAPALVL